MKQKLEGSVAGLVLGILSIITCPAYGIVALILGIIGLYQSNKAIKLNDSNPGIYEGIENARAGKIMSIIGIVLGALFFVAFIFWLVFLAAAITSASSTLYDL